jgi:hypothetical protein
MYLPNSIRLLTLLLLLGASLYSHIERENRVTHAQIMLSPAQREVTELQEGNAHLSYLLSRFEAPSTLFQTARGADYGHLSGKESALIAYTQERQTPQVKSSEHETQAAHHLAAAGQLQHKR